LIISTKDSGSATIILLNISANLAKAWVFGVEEGSGELHQ
jgi:hypothetical protein